jgi:hypothetical protein
LLADGFSVVDGRHRGTYECCRWTCLFRIGADDFEDLSGSGADAGGTVGVFDIKIASVDTGKVSGQVEHRATWFDKEGAFSAQMADEEAKLEEYIVADGWLGGAAHRENIFGKEYKCAEIRIGKGVDEIFEDKIAGAEDALGPNPYMHVWDKILLQSSRVVQALCRRCDEDTSFHLK